jgi:hypothetical protein
MQKIDSAFYLETFTTSMIGGTNRKFIQKKKGRSASSEELSDI